MDKKDQSLRSLPNGMPPSEFLRWSIGNAAYGARYRWADVLTMYRRHNLKTDRIASQQMLARIEATRAILDELECVIAERADYVELSASARRGQHH